MTARKTISTRKRTPDPHCPECGGTGTGFPGGICRRCCEWLYFKIYQTHDDVYHFDPSPIEADLMRVRDAAARRGR